MSDEIIPGSLDDVNPEGYDFFTLDKHSAKVPAEPPTTYEVCTTCGSVYSVRQMVRYKKKWYCKPHGCYRDIVGMRMKENPDATFKNKSLTDRFWKGD